MSNKIPAKSSTPAICAYNPTLLSAFRINHKNTPLTVKKRSVYTTVSASTRQVFKKAELPLMLTLCGPGIACKYDVPRRAPSFFRVIKTLFVTVFTVTHVVNPGLFTGKEMELSF